MDRGTASIIAWQKLQNADRCQIISESLLDKDIYAIQYLLRNVIEIQRKDYGSNLADEYDAFFLSSVLVDRLVQTVVNLTKYSKKTVQMWEALDRFEILGKKISLKNGMQFSLTESIYVTIDFEIRAIKDILRILNRPDVLLDRMIQVNNKQFNKIKLDRLKQLKKKLYKSVGGKRSLKFSEMCKAINIEDLYLLLCMQLYLTIKAVKNYEELRDTCVDHVDKDKAIRYYNDTGKFGYNFANRAVLIQKSQSTKQLSTIIWYMKDFCMIIYLIQAWIQKRHINTTVLCKVNSKGIDSDQIKSVLFSGKELDYSVKIYSTIYNEVNNLVQNGKNFERFLMQCIDGGILL